MATETGVISSLWRRRVLVVGLAYALAATALYFAARALEAPLGLPAWLDVAALWILVAGLAPALGLAWMSPASAPRAAPRPAAARSERAAIAILPFANLSGAPEDEVFADGMVEDLITGLALYPNLMVVARSSTFAYKGASPDIREVGADLDVGYVLEGSVRRAGERLRVTAQLIETEAGGHVWADHFDRPIAELFALQDELVRQIAAALGDVIGRVEYQRVARNPASVSAWEESMRCLSAQERPTLANIPEALKHARRAVELDPDYAIGHARLALSLVTRAQLTGGPAAAKDRAEATLHADRAVTLAPNDPSVLIIACNTLAWTGREAEAVRLGERAIGLNPNDATAYGVLGNALFRAGRPAEAIGYYEQEAELAPRSAFLNSRYIFRGLAHLMLGQTPEAIAALRRSLDLDPALAGAWAALSLALAASGDIAGAGEAVRRLRALDPSLGLDHWLGVIAANVPGPGAEPAMQGFRAAWAASEGV